MDECVGHSLLRSLATVVEELSGLDPTHSRFARIIRASLQGVADSGFSADSLRPGMLSPQSRNATGLAALCWCFHGRRQIR